VRLDENALERWGERIGATVSLPVVIALDGPLGVGKSVLARAIGTGAGVREPMPSPSYNLLLRYDTDRGTVVHLDLYRIESTDELWELGWAQLGAGPELVVVEWPARAGDFMPADYWVISLSVPDERPSHRDVDVRRVGHPPELPGFPMSLSAS
jgi:tRNA threonylcarbamoyl adenosine modification protein YjeE